MVPTDDITRFFHALDPMELLALFAFLVLFNGLLLTGVLLYLRRTMRAPTVQVPKPAESKRPPDLLEDLADGILGIDAEDRIVYATRRVEGLFGFSSEDLLQRNYQSLLVLPDGFSEASADHLSCRGTVIGLEHEALGLRKDGSRFNAHVTVTPRTGGTIRALVAVRERAHRKAMVREPPPLEGSGGEAVFQSARRIQKFMALLSRSDDLSPLDREFVRALQKSADDLYAHTTYAQFLEALRKESLKVEREPLLLGKWLEDKSAAYSERAGKLGSRCSLLVQDRELVVLVDETLLGQLIEGLLDFALTSYESDSIEVHLSHSPTAGKASSLPAIPETPGGETVAGGHRRRVNLFIFARASGKGRDRAGSEEGKLPEGIDEDPRIRLARKLVSLLGGDFSMEANDASSLLFQVTLACQSYGVDPVPALSLRNPDETVNEEEVSDSLPKVRGKTVLSIAENAELRAWVREILVAEGFEVEECPPARAVEKVRDGAPVDLVVLQSELNEEPDFDLTYEMRQFREAEDLPILLVSTTTQRMPQLSYFSTQGTIAFPSANGDLARKVSDLCESRRKGA